MSSEVRIYSRLKDILYAIQTAVHNLPCGGIFFLLVHLNLKLHLP